MTENILHRANEELAILTNEADAIREKISLYENDLSEVEHRIGLVRASIAVLPSLMAPRSAGADTVRVVAEKVEPARPTLVLDGEPAGNGAGKRHIAPYVSRLPAETDRAIEAELLGWRQRNIPVVIATAAANVGVSRSAIENRAKALGIELAPVAKRRGGTATPGPRNGTERAASA